MDQKVWIAGYGAISSIGLNVPENLLSLQAQQSGIGKAEYLNTVHADQLPVCEIKKSNQELAAMCGMKRDLPRTVYLSAIAAREAIQHAASMVRQAGRSIREKPWRTGFISGNTLGGMDRTENFYRDFLNDPKQGHLKDVIYHECGSVTELVADHIGISDLVTTISTACSSSANSILHACRLIKHHKLDIVIAGGADALCRFTLNGFNSLMILDPQPCRPFDESRAGLNLGEAAAYLVLVSDKVKQELDIDTRLLVSGYANANDAFHQTASSAEGNGNFNAMQEALQVSRLAPSDIQYINAHGTGTSNNDGSEGIAIQRLFGEQIPMVSSTKANTGHTLGACGALEAVYSCLALKHNMVFPNLRYRQQMKELQFTPVNQLIADRTINHVMSNSFGFGGNCSSLIFSKEIGN